MLREGDSVFVVGTVPGFRTRVDLGEAPSLQKSIARISEIDEAQVLAAAAADHARSQPREAPVMMPS